MVLKQYGTEDRAKLRNILSFINPKFTMSLLDGNKEIHDEYDDDDDEVGDNDEYEDEEESEEENSLADPDTPHFATTHTSEDNTVPLFNYLCEIGIFLDRISIIHLLHSILLFTFFFFWCLIYI